MSSHVLSEVQQTVDDVVIIAHGRLIRQAPLTELAAEGGVLVRTPQPDALGAALTGAGFTWRIGQPDALEVDDASAAQVGHLAYTAGVELHGLEAIGDDLERVFLRLVAGTDEPALAWEVVQ